MHHYKGLLSWYFLLTSLGGAQAKLDLNSSKNLVVYWGQNSFNGQGDKAQQPLAHYCEDKNIDVIAMAFNMMVNGPGGEPEIDFALTSKDCDVFPGTQLKNCPNIGKDITTCQQKGKTILLSIGGATYSEGGFKSEADAKDGAKLMWDTFGPQKDGSKSLRPFGAAILDGFDFDFEANVQNMAPFANELRSLMDADQSKQRFYLTAAPQCPYPDAADKEILNGPVYIDAIWVQFYNNFCGVNNFNTDMSSNKYNFEEWDNWAKTVSKNKNVKVLVGVPADTTAASTGYIPSSKLDNVIEYSKKFESFGGIMMWDATQAYGNDGFINDVRKSLGGADDSGSSPDPASSSAPPPPPATSTDSATKTSSSSSVPDSSPSSSSSSSASASPKGPDTTTPAQPTTDAKPTTTDAKPTTTDAKPTTTDANPTTTAAPPTADPAKPSTTQAPAPTTSAAPQDDNSDDDDSQDEGQNDEGSLSSILGTDLMGLLGGLRRANGLAGGITDGLTKGLRRPQRSRV